MANKDYVIDENIALTVYKRRGSRNLRLSIASNGKVRVTIPAWAPYVAGVNFAKSRKEWILSQSKPAAMLVQGQAIGKAHRLEFVPDPSAQKITSKVKGSLIQVKYPDSLEPESSEVQAAATEASVKALRAQAEQLLPQRLATLAKEHGFSYKSVAVKRLKSRWGSCDQHSNIVLNLFLIQLPWELIDYVLLHELTHTKVLKHGPDFWQAMEKVAPQVKQLRKAVKDYQPVIRTII